jgi:hypothetical protein
MLRVKYDGQRASATGRRPALARIACCWRAQRAQLAGTRPRRPRMRGMAGLVKCHSRPPGVASHRGFAGCTTPPGCCCSGWPRAASDRKGARSRVWHRPGARHGRGRAAGRRELMRPASAIVSAWMSVPPRSQMLPWVGGAGRWLLLDVAYHRARGCAAHCAASSAA